MTGFLEGTLKKRSLRFSFSSGNVAGPQPLICALHQSLTPYFEGVAWSVLMPGVIAAIQTFGCGRRSSNQFLIPHSFRAIDLREKGSIISTVDPGVNFDNFAEQGVLF